MTRFLLFVIALALGFQWQNTAQAQRFEEDFLDDRLVLTGEQFASFKRVWLYSRQTRLNGELKVYYTMPEGKFKLYSQGSYQNLLKEGKHYYFYQDSTLKAEVEFAQGHPVGKGYYYHPNGQLMEVRHYQEPGPDTYMQGPEAWNPAYTVHSAYSPQGEVLVSNGTGTYTYYHNNGSIAAQGPLLNYKRNGTWKGYFPDGKAMYQELYEEGRFVNGRSYDEGGRLYTYSTNVVAPEPLNGFDAFYDRFERKVRTPLRALLKGTQGTVYLGLVVDRNGQISDIYVARDIGSNCGKAAVKAMRKMKASWRPPIVHGQRRRMAVVMPVHFIRSGADIDISELNNRIAHKEVY